MPWEMRNPADVAGGAAPEYYLIPDPPRGDGDWPGVEPGQSLTMPPDWDSNEYVSAGTYSAGTDVQKTNSYRPQGQTFGGSSRPKKSYWKFNLVAWLILLGMLWIFYDRVISNTPF